MRSNCASCRIAKSLIELSLDRWIICIGFDYSLDFESLLRRIDQESSTTELFYDMRDGDDVMGRQLRQRPMNLYQHIPL